ncbi:META domain-containing protein [Flavobacterium dauae]|uniref:META domain-containing protein n=1 Tax=Flavobacterium dauae TaxID=1563479 RepID=UPI00101B49C8|nr:META domain-containing protein [Flavobacterium dauae]WLD24004.1 META domain-containing protein [Flavobacterium dauae]
MQVKESKVPCTGVAPMECLQVKIGNEKEWTYFYDPIEGFDFEAGYRYKLKVEKAKREGNLPADVSAYTYKLKKVVSKKKVKSVATKNVDILNKKMVLSEINGKKVDNGSVYFTLDSNTNSINGKSGCNRFGTTFQLNGNKLEVGRGAATLMACDNESMRLEQEFLDIMSLKKFDIETSGSVVKFKKENSKEVVMEFNIPTENDIWSFIDGKKWKLFMLNNVSQDYGKAFIQFDVKNKKVNGNSSCNNFFGTYTTIENTITFKALGSTRMACLDEETAETESKMLKHLSEATVNFDVAEQTLNFYIDDRLIMMFGLYTE